MAHTEDYICITAISGASMVTPKSPPNTGAYTTFGGQIEEVMCPITLAGKKCYHPQIHGNYSEHDSQTGIMSWVDHQGVEHQAQPITGTSKIFHPDPGVKLSESSTRRGEETSYIASVGGWEPADEEKPPGPVKEEETRFGDDDGDKGDTIRARHQKGPELNIE
jgi:hypothetical protein